MKTKYIDMINIGVSNNYSNNLNKKIKLINIYTLTWIHLCVLFIIADISITRQFHIDVFLTNGIAFLSLTLILFLNYKKKHLLARFWFMASSYTVISLVCFFAFSGAYLEYYFIVLSGIVISVYDNIFIKIFTLISSYILFLLTYYYFNIYNSYEVNKLLPVAVFGIFVSVFSIINYFKGLNQKNEKLLALERDNALSDKIILEKQEAELRELNEFKSHFFINLSHEIRTPVTLIKGYISKVNFENKENKENLTVVNNQIQQVENILNNILDLSKLDENKLTLERNHIEIIPFLNKHYSDFKGVFQKRNIDFNLNSNIYSLAIHMDANLISKSINNLLSNALKFTSQNGTVNIDVLFNENLEINITDNGIGIEPKDLDKIFNRFYQAKNHITQSQGSGIGLSFSKSIIDAHGFSMTVTSQPNVKTSFNISIPKEFISTTSISNTNTVKKENPNNTKQKKEAKNIPTILIVDDHEQLRKYLADTLQQYNIIEAENGKEALNVLTKNNNIDLLLTDYMMPIMDGEALVKEVKKLDIKIPIIVLTARVDDFAKLNMLRIGVDGYLNKPFIEEELQLFVKNSLRLYHKILENQNTLSTEEKTELNEHAQKFNQKITNYIVERITDLDLSNQDIADHLNISQSTLNRRVKSILGQTTKQLILQVKIEKARELHITNPYLSKKEIGFSVGIKNTSYLFNKIAEKYGKHYEN